MLDDIPRPWKITDNGSAFAVVDGIGRSVAYFYYHHDSHHLRFLTKEEARACAVAFARISKG